VLISRPALLSVFREHPSHVNSSYPCEPCLSESCRLSGTLDLVLLPVHPFGENRLRVRTYRRAGRLASPRWLGPGCLVATKPDTGANE
jgi:hypothetical protein